MIPRERDFSAKDIMAAHPIKTGRTVLLRKFVGVSINLGALQLNESSFHQNFDIGESQSRGYCTEFDSLSQVKQCGVIKLYG